MGDIHGVEVLVWMKRRKWAGNLCPSFAVYFLISNAMSLAESCSCQHALPALIDCSFQLVLQKKPFLSLLAFVSYFWNRSVKKSNGNFRLSGPCFGPLASEEHLLLCGFSHSLLISSYTLNSAVLLRALPSSLLKCPASKSRSWYWVVAQWTLNE